MRLFIAVRFTDEVKKALLGTMHDLKQKGIKGNYTAGANLHLTLAFIGETRDKEEVIKAMDRISFTPFKLSVRELGTFGDILWAGVKGNQGLKGIAKDVRAQLDASGILTTARSSCRISRSCAGWEARFPRVSRGRRPI